MDDNEEPADGEREPRENHLGAGIAIGVGVGAALMAALDNPAWIGIGIALGAGIGVALSNRSR